MKMFFSRLLTAVGALLIALSALGYLLDPALPESTGDRAALEEMLDRREIQFDLQAASDAVSNGLIHSSARRIRLYENWILWLGGHLYEPLSHTQDPRRIVAGGGGLCGEVAVVLNGIAERNGVQARLIALNGHMVSEVKTRDGWRVADPDYGVVYPVDLKHLEGPDGPRIVRLALDARGYGADRIETYIDLFQSPHDNLVLEVGAASSPRLYKAEVIADWLKWLIPAAFVIGGVLACPANTSRRRQGLTSRENQ